MPKPSIAPKYGWSDELVAVQARNCFEQYREYCDELVNRGYKVTVRQATKELVITKEVRI